MNKPFNERLKEERNRINKTQDDFAKLGGVGRSAQIKYEAGDRKPDSDYLQAVSPYIDIYYLMTGDKFETSKITEEQGNTKIYQQPADTLQVALEVQTLYSLKFSAEQLKALMGMAWQYQLGYVELAKFVETAYAVSGISLGD